MYIFLSISFSIETSNEITCLCYIYNESRDPFKVQVQEFWEIVNIFLIHQFKHLFWVLKVSMSFRMFFGVPIIIYALAVFTLGFDNQGGFLWQECFLHKFLCFLFFVCIKISPSFLKLGGGEDLSKIGVPPPNSPCQNKDFFSWGVGELILIKRHVYLE